MSSVNLVTDNCQKRTESEINENRRPHLMQAVLLMFSVLYLSRVDIACVEAVPARGRAGAFAGGHHAGVGRT